MENRQSEKLRPTLIAVSFLVCLAIGTYLALARRPVAHQQSTPTVSIEKRSDPQEADINKDFRTAPEAFAQMDFKNHSYGSYRLGSRRKIDLRLKDGELEYDYRREESGWFDVKDVYYADVTGDEAPEAVVMLSHVACGVSCDGGAALFYIYSVRKQKLHQIWKYETGSLAYGCGLKSFTVEDKQITLEVFGRCTKEATENPGPGKFVVEDLTRLVFRFNGRRVVRSGLKFFSAPATDVRNYKPEIRIRA